MSSKDEAAGEEVGDLNGRELHDCVDDGGHRESHAEGTLARLVADDIAKDLQVVGACVADDVWRGQVRPLNTFGLVGLEMYDTEGSADGVENVVDIVGGDSDRMGVEMGVDSGVGAS
jgi:hypothetical protein